VALTQRLIDGLAGIHSIKVYGGQDARNQAAIVSLTIPGKDLADVGLQLDEEYGIMCRVGLHCAPAAHRTIGTFPDGTLRFGLGAFNTLDEIDRALAAVRDLAEHGSEGQ